MASKILKILRILAFVGAMSIALFVGIIYFGFKNNGNSIKKSLASELSHFKAPINCTESSKEIADTESGIIQAVIYECDTNGKLAHDNITKDLVNSGYKSETDYTKDDYDSLTYKSKKFVALYIFNPSNPSAAGGPGFKQNFDDLHISKIVLNLYRNH